MGCSGDREKGIAPLEEKWDYVVSALSLQTMEMKGIVFILTVIS